MVSKAVLYHLINHGTGDPEVKRPSEEKESSARDVPSEARPTGRPSQVALDVVDVPEDLGTLLDKGLEDHFRDR